MLILSIIYRYKKMSAFQYVKFMYFRSLTGYWLYFMYSDLFVDKCLKIIIIWVFPLEVRQISIRGAIIIVVVIVVAIFKIFFLATRTVVVFSSPLFAIFLRCSSGCDFRLRSNTVIQWYRNTVKSIIKKIKNANLILWFDYYYT
jgi:hypothetical protein